MTNEKRKSGPLSKKEREILDRHLTLKTDEELSILINRSEEAIAKYRASQGRVAEMTNETADVLKRELKSEYFWEELKIQLSEEELKSFENRWISLMNQFKDVLATDKMQMVDLIRCEILMNRLLVEQKFVRDEMKRVQNELEEYYAKDVMSLEAADHDVMARLTTDYNQLMASHGTRDNTLDKLGKEKKSLLGALKATRDQRVNLLENNKTTFWDLLRMFDDYEIKEREGRHMELVRVAAKQKENELFEFTEFEDGTVDRVILFPELLEGVDDEQPKQINTITAKQTDDVN